MAMISYYWVLGTCAGVGWKSWKQYQKRPPYCGERFWLKKSIRGKGRRRQLSISSVKESWRGPLLYYKRGQSATLLTNPSQLRSLLFLDLPPFAFLPFFFSFNFCFLFSVFFVLSLAHLALFWDWFQGKALILHLRRADLLVAAGIFFLCINLCFWPNFRLNFSWLSSKMAQSFDFSGGVTLNLVRVHATGRTGTKGFSRVLTASRIDEDSIS